MKFMGWSWFDLQRTPVSVVATALDRMAAHAEATRQSNKHGR
jgi:hypothetical protein